MDTVCPVCNGFTSLQEVCPKCGDSMQDGGPISYLYGPYSPYRDIEHQKLSNDYPDIALHQCIHVGYCDNCNEEHLCYVTER